MTDYSKSVIYGIYCKDITVLEFYIGSTYDEKQRERHHKDHCNNENNKSYDLKVYKFIRANGGMDNWIFKVIQRFPCENKIQLVEREQYHYDLLNPALNMRRPYLSEEERKEERKKRKEERKEEISKLDAIYYQEHIVERKIYREKYQKEHRDEIKEHKNQKNICECGGKYTNANKALHLETNRHKNFLKNQEN